MIKRIDFHTHILPNIDDGSSSVEESIAMLKILTEANVEMVALTPHFYPDRDYPDAFLERRNAAYDILVNSLKGSSYPKLLLGAEVAYFDGIRTCDEMKKFVIEGTNCLLVELPEFTWNARIFENILRLSTRINVTPILAHIDRYNLRRNEMKLLTKFVDAGGLIQGNADSFLNRSTEKKTLKLLEKGLIHVFGSDCHNMMKRPPMIGKAFDIIDQKAKSSLLNTLNNTIDTVVIEL